MGRLLTQVDIVVCALSLVYFLFFLTSVGKEQISSDQTLATRPLALAHVL